MTNDANVGLTVTGLTPPPPPSLTDLNAKLDYLIGLSNAMYPKAGHRVVWQDKVTKSGITLDGTSATALTQGYLLGVTFMPTGPGQGVALMICRPEGKQEVAVVESTNIRFVDE